MVAKERRSRRRTKDNPFDELAEFAKANDLTQFRCELHRLKEGGGSEWLKNYTIEKEQILNIQEWVEPVFGGGTYVAKMSHPNDPSNQVLEYEFGIAGPPKAPTAQQQQQAATPWPGSSMGMPGYGPAAAPVRPPMGPSFPPGIAGYQGAGYYNQQPRYGSDYRESREASELKRRLEQLEAENRRLEQMRSEERHRAEVMQMQERWERQLEESRRQHQDEMRILREELRSANRDDGGSGKELFAMFMKSAEMQQSTLMSMLSRDSDSSREQMKHMKEQMQEDLKFRREMYDLAMNQKDPTQAAAMLDVMGQQTASMLSLIQQAVSSGLLGQSEGDPTWYKAVQKSLETLQGFGERFLQAKQQQAMMGGMSPVPQPGTPRLPGPRVPMAQRGLGQTMGPRQALDAQSDQPQPRVPGQSAVEPGPQEDQPPPLGQPVEVEEGQVAQRPPNLLTPIYDFLGAMSEEADPEVVADMVYGYCDFLRANNMMPKEWAEVFVEPAKTLRSFINTYAPTVDVTDDYLDEIGLHILETEEEEFGSQTTNEKVGQKAEEPEPEQADQPEEPEPESKEVVS